MYQQKGVRKPASRLLNDEEKKAVHAFSQEINYSKTYKDDDWEYRHVILPKLMLKAIPKDYFDHESGTLRILTEDEWRGLGIIQSPGWEHYETHQPEPWILLFKRDLAYSNAAAAARYS